MEQEPLKIGVISCSGEEIPEGTISRLATRRVLELLRPDSTVTLCLPLFLAGGEGEREFARQHPTIAVDGCEKQCAMRGTEMHSGPVGAALVVSAIIGDGFPGCQRSLRSQGVDDKAAVWAVADRIAAEVDALLAQQTGCAPAGDSGASCSCSRSLPGGTITVGGAEVKIAGLPVIFDQLAAAGLAADAGAGSDLLRAVSVYYPIPAGEAEAYREALVTAYQAHCGSR